MPDETAYPVLRNAPIVESIAYFRFAEPVAGEQLRSFRERIIGAFPIDDTTDVGESHEARFVYASNDRKRFVRVGLNDFALHKLAPYGDGNDFRSELRILWDEFRATYPAVELQQVTLRAINAIQPIEGEEDQIDYFETCPVLGVGISTKLFAASMRLGIVHPEQDNIKAVIVWAAQTPSDPANRVTFIFDIEVSHFFETPEEATHLWDSMERLRAFRNQIFFQSITDKTKELYK